MARTDRFRNQHVGLLELVDKVSAQLNVDQLSQDATQVRTLLSKLFGNLKLHIAAEDTIFYPELAASSDPKVSATAKKFATEMGATAKIIEQYNATWATPSLIKDRASAFVVDTRRLIAALKDRIQRENNELYALADKVDGANF